MIIDLSQLSANQAYFTLAQTIIPRPIAWVLTENTPINEQASYNLAPFSFFNAITGDPPIILFTLGQKPNGDDKDTLVNIQRLPHFVVHIASSKQLAALNASSATLDYGDSEVDASQLSLTHFESSPLPRIKNAPMALHCELLRLDEIGHTPQKLIYAEVKSMWVDDAAIEQYSTSPFRLKINAQTIDPLLRLGAAEYAAMGEINTLMRPD